MRLTRLVTFKLEELTKLPPRQIRRLQSPPPYPSSFWTSSNSPSTLSKVTPPFAPHILTSANSIASRARGPPPARVLLSRWVDIHSEEQGEIWLESQANYGSSTTRLRLRGIMKDELAGTEPPSRLLSLATQLAVVESCGRLRILEIWISGVDGAKLLTRSSTAGPPFQSYS